MSKDNNNGSVEMEINIKIVVRGPEVTELHLKQRQLLRQSQRRKK